jgi:hypothetical protein
VLVSLFSDFSIGNGVVYGGSSSRRRLLCSQLDRGQFRFPLFQCLAEARSWKHHEHFGLASCRFIPQATRAGLCQLALPPLSPPLFADSTPASPWLWRLSTSKPRGERIVETPPPSSRVRRRHVGSNPPDITTIRLLQPLTITSDS